MPSRKPFSHRAGYAAAALAWWALTVWLLLKPAGGPGGIPHLDKLGHAALFGAQAWLLAGATGWRPARVWLALVPWALGSEALQGWLTADRSPEALDALADLAGAALALRLAPRRLGRP